MTPVAWQETTDNPTSTRAGGDAGGAAPGGRREPRVADLAAVWSRISRDRLGINRQEWFHPAVQEVLASLDLGLDLTWPLARLGGAGAGGGVSLRTTPDDLDVLAGLLPVEPAYALDRLSAAGIVAEAWLEA